ncbi:hypothetical protein IAE19_01390 [Acinetobacter sp. S40]|uniref:hypothetical protein n=1 Tax=Acinetobacter sp. S40 TaxID=2767434 RepID=UPI00190DED39|nr:hypothetical protein [Acinetobacter sp. S40]MBJ9984096.1 hypothetical protein [Acinetobacter sp. S40]
MNFIKYLTVVPLLISMCLPAVQANEVASLPTIHAMAESELREEVGFVPFQEDKPVRQALRHHVDKIQNDIQNPNVNETPYIEIDYQPVTTPDMSQLSPFLQQYILSITSGLQSSDPTSGVFNMLEPLDINRNNIAALREGTIKINMEQAIKFQQQIREGLGMK